MSGAMSSIDADLPLVSIITPSFNQADYLEETILSVLNQDYPNIEYIVIDGGSTDGSVEIIERYADRLAYWVSEPDEGQAHATNKGWRRSTGEIIAYINSDDPYLPGALSTTVDYFRLHPDIGLVYASSYASQVENDQSVVQSQEAPPFNLVHLARRCFIAQPTVFFRRSVLESIGFLDESFHYCMDYDYWMRAAAVTKFGRLRSYTAVTRYHSNSKTGSQLPGFLRDEVRMFDRMSRSSVARERQLARIGLVGRLAPAVGAAGGYGEADSSQFRARLQQMHPPPSLSELASAIAWSDEHFVNSMDTSSSKRIPEEWRREDVIVDWSDSVRVMIDMGLLRARMGARLTRRLRARAILREIIHGRCPLTSGALTRLLLQITSQDPTVLVSREWWFCVIMSIPLGKSTLSVYRRTRWRERLLRHSA
jgi:GT2 family glycosyltransferase